jgi:ppGpp synthetase/RelA/SpoT-type nucleotidyltranferase
VKALRFILILIIAGILNFILSVSVGAVSLCRYSIADLYYTENGWMNVIVPTQNGFEIKKIENPLRLNKVVDAEVVANQKAVDAFINDVALHYENVIEKLKPIAIEHRAQFKFRLKDPDSLRNKIIERAKEFPESFGRLFKISDLHDVVGTRLIVKAGNPLHRFDESKNVWAKLLRIKPEQILEVEIKGKKEDCIRGKCYRAVHLAIELSRGVRFELQIQSRAVSHWHTWDHRTVYKNPKLSGDEKKQYREYSQAWMKTISLLEDIKTGKASLDELKALHVDLDINFGWLSWPSLLDQHLANKFLIPYESRFLILPIKRKSIIWFEPNRELIKDLTRLALTYNP